MSDNIAFKNATGWMEAINETIDLLSEAETQNDQEDVIQSIYDAALSVEVRSGWNNVGSSLEAEEYRIILTVGGPSLAIYGELNSYGEPVDARMVYADQSTPPTDLPLSEKDYDNLLNFAFFLLSSFLIRG